ncbi:aldo/keto reductase [Demetria terragena]|uniref:aldo/keto reductase n=1 Tax=Demetria terragena TaxID=63959 RepID=UPI000375C1B5|nr:aldo/keto reductase [Demetria terragena]
MRTRHVGSSGLQVSPLTLSTAGWGTTVDDDMARTLAETYLGADGMTFATTAGDDQAEETLGSLLGDLVPRRDVTLVCQAGSGAVGPTGSRGSMLRDLDDTLSRLRTDHLDLWLAPGWSATVRLEETLGALEFAVLSGRARYVGVSGLTGWQLARAFSLLENLRVPLVADQVEYSLLRRAAEATIQPAATYLGTGILAGAPLGRGVLTGKYRHTVPADSRGASRPDHVSAYLDDDSRAVVEAVCTAADGLDLTPAEVALRWVLDRDGVASAVVGVRTPGQLRSAAQAATDALPIQVTNALNDVSAFS